MSYIESLTIRRMRAKNRKLREALKECKEWIADQRRDWVEIDVAEETIQHLDEIIARAEKALSDNRQHKPDISKG